MFQRLSFACEQHQADHEICATGAGALAQIISVLGCEPTLAHAAPTIVMSPAHCYYDDTTEINQLVPQYYKNATAQIGRCCHTALSTTIALSMPPLAKQLLLCSVYMHVSASSSAIRLAASP